MPLNRVRYAAALAALALCGGCGTKTEPAPAANDRPQPAENTSTAGGATRPGVAPPPITPPSMPSAPPVSPNALPSGALFRLGTESGTPPNAWKGAELLPTGTRVFAPHSAEQPHSFQHFTLYDVNGLRPLGAAVHAECNPGGGLGPVAAVSADGRFMAAVNVKTLDVHDLGTGKRVLQLPRPENGSPTMSLSADGGRLAITGRFQRTPGDVPVTCTVWDVKTAAELARVTILQNEYPSAALSPDGKTLITSGSHRDLRGLDPADRPDRVSQVWDVDSKAELARPRWPNGRTVVYAPDSTTAAVVVYSSAQLLVVEPRTGKTRHTIELKDIGTGPVAFSPDGATLALVTDAATRWDVATGKAFGTTPRPKDLPEGVKASGAAFDANGRLVAFGTRDAAAYCWDALAGKLLTAPAGGHTGPVRTVAFTADGAEIRTAGADGAVLRWAAADGKPLGRVSAHPAERSGPFDVRLSRDGRRAVTRDEVYPVDGTAPPTSFRPLFTTNEFAQASYPAPDGAHVAVIGVAPGKSARCVVFDVAAAKPTFDVPLPTRMTRAVGAIGANPQRLVTAHSTEIVNNTCDVVVTGWDAGKKRGEFTIPGGGVLQGLVRVDDRHAVVVTAMGHVVLVDVETGTRVRDFADPTRLSSGVPAISPDGKLLALAQGGRQSAARQGPAIRVYDVGTGAVRHTIAFPYGGPPVFLKDSTYLFNNTPAPETMAFSPDGTRLAVPALTSVLVWDLTKVGPEGEAR
ncbi:hypothetical protein R5W23_003875 [Gemmata sp. JC673]|uniref:WD40 repeat domain-containing protein n=1 Tax=Gemmata algarum TaxID=2975278 RepID=A0ABU5F991_9BACT|nr:hypothetical protein [Gemmata algarum]MDY3562409.1 hypothetical protein [Gemmata algarum]